MTHTIDKDVIREVGKLYEKLPDFLKERNENNTKK